MIIAIVTKTLSAHNHRLPAVQRSSKVLGRAKIKRKSRSVKVMPLNQEICISKTHSIEISQFIYSLATAFAVDSEYSLTNYGRGSHTITFSRKT